jgi:peptidoglycan-associated lipoprotein
MSPTPFRTLMLALAAVAVLAAGCARKTAPVQSPPTPPVTQPTSPSTPPEPAPAPVPTAPSTPAAAFTDLAIVHFALDSYSLDDAARAILDKNAKLMRDNPGWTVTVAGHCDERGTAEYNQALGEKRANAVRDYLVGAGVPDSRVKTVSYGKEMPVDEGHDESAWAKNRRAEFTR